jgi:uncharacterized protein with PIN domain
MIVVDSSTLIALLSRESDAALCATALSEADGSSISAATLLETGIVMMNRYGQKAIPKGLPLLFKGRDFSGTDVESVL